tara:strand:- start:1122 stop:1349 length:228 start_codon:yes stop_codon:yes gene_type:complete
MDAVSQGKNAYGLGLAKEDNPFMKAKLKHFPFPYYQRTASNFEKKMNAKRDKLQRLEWKWNCGFAIAKSRGITSW